MNLTVPQLRTHSASGQYVSKLNGQTLYMGRELAQAWSCFLPKLAEWREKTGQQGSVTVWEAAVRLSERVSADNEHASIVPTFAHLKPFCLEHGGKLVSDISVDDLEAYKTKLQADGYAPKSVNHFMAAAKRLLRYSAFRGWRAAIELSFIRSVRLPSPPPKQLSLQDVDAWLKAASSQHEQLNLWLRVQLATAARPSEVIRLARKEGSWTEAGIFCFNKGKTNKKVAHPRCLAIPKELLPAVEAMQPRWNSQASYAQACNAAFNSGSHRLRHTGAHLLHRLPGEKVSREETDVFLGHYPAYVSLVYNPIDWDKQRLLANRYYEYLRAVLPQHYN